MRLPKGSGMGDQTKSSTNNARIKLALGIELEKVPQEKTEKTGEFDPGSE